MLVAQMVKHAPTARPTAIVVEEVPGQESTLAVGPAGKPGQGLVGEHKDWMRLFGDDKDGDNVLFELFKVLYSRANDKERDQLLHSVAELYESVAVYDLGIPG